MARPKAAKLSVVSDPLDAYIAAITSLPERFLVCRDTQHRWPLEPPPFHVVDSKRETGRRARGGHAVYAERVFVCERCGMERSDAYQITSLRGRTSLRRINASYDPPDGYRIEGVGQSVRGMRDLLHGVMFDRAVADTPVQGRGRPKKTS